MKNISNPNELQRIDSLYENISNLIDKARESASKTITTTEVYCKYGIGKFIIENELNGKYRASYGKKILKILSSKLTDKFGNGWSVESLTLCRKFYSVYSKIVNTVYEIGDSLTNNPTIPNFNLSWSHYLILMRIENHEERQFYEIETSNQNWSVRQLQRQVSSSLIDLKTDKLTHQDLGQMQMYVNYFDRYIKQEHERPTIGILLCKTKSDSLVKLTLPKDANIYAQQYALCLPDKKLLKEKLKEWISEYEEFKHNS